MKDLDHESIDVARREFERLNPPSEWYRYRCPTCDAVSWVEDIIVDAFPPTHQGGAPALGCIDCNNLCYWDSDVPTVFSREDPSINARDSNDE